MLRKRRARRDATPKRNEPRAARLTVPGYELSAKKAGLLPWKWATDRLKKSRQYWIATTRPDGTAHLIIIWGVWLDAGFLVQHGGEITQGPQSGREP